MSDSSEPSFDVALDAMGGDRAPDVPVRAALQATARGARVALVGDRTALEAALVHAGATKDALSIHHAPEAIGMDEHPSDAIRKKRHSSMRVAAELVAGGRAQTVLSAGNTGAVMAVGLLVLGRLPHLSRPALASAIPTAKEPLLILDLGANVDPTALQLAQFAVMGDAYARVALGRPKPRVALLSNGTEATKGSPRTREAAELLRAAPLEFTGYCEGRDLFQGELDVVVTDGFTGNALLKTLEGFVAVVRAFVEAEVRSSRRAALGALLLKPALARIKKRLDHEQVGAAPLLGLQHPCFVAHGGSSVDALTNALLLTRRGRDPAIVSAISDALTRGAALGLWPSKPDP